MGRDRRRVWRKLHLAVDIRTGALHAHALTASEVHDGAELEGLLARTDAPIATVCADKAYDSFDCHAAILARDAQPVIPPRKGAAIRPPPGRKDVPPTRGEAVARIAPASPRSGATPARRRPATTAAPSPRPQCCVTRR